MQIHNALRHNLMINHFIVIMIGRILAGTIRKISYLNYSVFIAIMILNCLEDLFSICQMSLDLQLLYYFILNESFNQIYLQ